MRTNETKIIKNFKGENAWLSNMHQFTLPGDSRPTSVEGLFQSSKALCLRNDVQDEHLYDEIAYANPYEARKLGRNIKDLDVEKWNASKLVIMAKAVFTKFTTDKELNSKLFNAGLSTYLIEENTWGDTYWGIYNQKGHNYLGKLLMYVREILFSNEAEELTTFYDDDIAIEILEYEHINEKITERLLDEKYPMPKQLKLDIQMSADKTSLDVSPCETSSKEVLNINKKEENKMNNYMHIIAHQVNCMGKMGAGFAKQVKEAFPECFLEYETLCKNNRKKLLGTYSIYKINDKLAIANLFGQYKYGKKENGPYTDYTALENAVVTLRNNYPSATIIVPDHIGCGLAGGDWDIVFPMLNKYNIKISNKIDLISLKKGFKFNPNKEYNSLSTINEYYKDLPIYLVKLTPNLWKINKNDNEETRAQKSLVLNKYFRFENHMLDRFHLPDLTEDEYENEIGFYKNVKPRNQKFKTASDYFKRKVQMNIVLRDLGIEGYSEEYRRACRKQAADRLSLKGYRGSPELFEFPSWEDNMYWLREEKYLQDMFDPDNKYPSLKELYIDSDPYRSTDYIDIFTKCWNLVKKLVKYRLIMITGADSLIFGLCNLLKKTDGLQGGASKGQIASLEKYYKEIKNITDNKEVSEWVTQGNNDYTLYVLNGDSTTAKDYVETYQKILRTVFNVRPNESLNEFKWYLKFECLGNKQLKDRLESVILKNEGIETEYLWDSKSSDESEDIEDNPEYYEDCLLSI